jgi:predicted tellurium resistance membrane protein TerC
MSTNALLNLFTLTGLEIVLGIDNIILIALLVQNLHGSQRTKARVIGLSLALIFRIIMLFGATWIMTLTAPLFTISGFPVSGRHLLLIIGGSFLIIKSVMELFELFGENQTKDNEPNPKERKTKYIKIISQIVFIDIILSFDSIITAVGISNDLPIMVAAVVIAMIVMLIASNPVGEFIYKNPSIKVLALAFIALVGVMLVLNGLDINFNKGYLYFAMFFAGIVEIINIFLRKKINKDTT